MIIKEGLAEILVPENKDDDGSECDIAVFYNPVQEFNRDMSVAAINVFCEQWTQAILEKRQKKRAKQSETFAENAETEASEAVSPSPKITVLEALSATGLRALRYAKECPALTAIIANDMDATAVEAINHNIAHNNETEKVKASQGDANMVMYESLKNGTSFHIIDLDPYGTAAPFLDAAVRGVRDGGMLCVTCTDMVSLAGGQLESCFVKYGGLPVPNSSFCHEMGLRMLLHTLQTTAARYKRSIKPLMSCSIDFYIRVFVQVNSSPSEATLAVRKTGLVYCCSGCKAYYTSNLGTAEGNKFKVTLGPPVNQICDHCGNKFHVGGPFYSGKLHDADFVQSMIEHVTINESKYKTQPRMIGMLTVISEELDDVLFYYHLPSVCGNFHCTTPPLRAFSSAILHLGYRLSASHCSPASIKTDAPPAVLWDIIRCWVKDHPVSMKKLKDPIAIKLLEPEPSIIADFSKHPNAEPPSRKIKLVRYQENPTKNWGPKARARPSKRRADAEDGPDVDEEDESQSKKTRGQQQSGGEQDMKAA